MCVSLMNHFEAKVGAVKNVSPGVQDTSLSFDDTLVKIIAIEIESHSANTQSSKPNANDGPGAEEEV